LDVIYDYYNNEGSTNLSKKTQKLEWRLLKKLLQKNPPFRIGKKFSIWGEKS
jgi:hypothetical protein